MARRPLLLLVNPASGGKPAAPPPLAAEPEALEPGALLAALRERGLEVELHVLEADDDPAALAAGAVRDGRDVVVAGGDGTVAPVASALRGTEATLGILAMGSWNNVARGSGVPTELEPALDVIVAGRAVAIDVGLAWHPAAGAGSRGEPPDDATPFFEAAGVGLDAAAFSAAQVGERRGTWQALRMAWRALRRRRSAMRLVVDGRELRVRSPAVTACNGPYHGAGFALAPEADPTDGMLHVVVFAGMSRLEVIRHFASVARGRPRREPRVSVVRGSRVTVHGVRRILPAHADGRSIGLTPVAFAVQPGALRVFSRR
ncbi:MAG: diacylglycerol/lipid kinase family protein [Candidatus Limnocylindria bacterium]